MVRRSPCNSSPTIFSRRPLPVILPLFVGAVVGCLIAAGFEVVSETLAVAAAYVGIAVGLLVGLAVIIVLVQANVLFNYQDTDSFGRGAFGVLGIAVVGGSIWYFWKGKKEKAG